MRSAPKESAEMVSQLVFGDICTKLEEQPGWCKVEQISDQYTGWVNPHMLLELSNDDFLAIESWRYVVAGSLLLADGSYMRLPLGAKVPILSGQPAREFRLNGHNWIWDTDLQLIPPQEATERVAVAKYFLNTPYLWGGRSGFGIDCSGFSQQVFAICGIPIPRDSSQQGLQGQTVAFGEHRAGDLAFFSKPGKERISHVGILINETYIIHASAKVRQDICCDRGILHAESQELTHQLLSIKRW